MFVNNKTIVVYGFIFPKLSCAPYTHHAQWLRSLWLF
jgi:hypothetical protein